MLTKDAVLQMNESDLRQLVIIPLMEAMRFRDVFETHGSRERGKDVIGWKAGALGSREYTAVVAKAKRFSGSSAAGDVAKQVNQAFNSPVQEPRGLEECTIHRVWVIVNKPLRLETREQIRDQIDQMRVRHVEFLDGNELWREIERYLPTSVADTIEEAQQQLQALDTSYGVRLSITPEGKRLEVGEKYPGQLQNEPLIFTGTLRFPDTPEGREKLEAYQASLATGAPVELPEDFFELRIPESLERLTEDVLGFKPEKFTSLHLSSIDDSRRFPVRIDIECDDGDTASLSYVEWRVVQSGSEEITLSNDVQPFPILVAQVVNLCGSPSQLTFGQKEAAIAAPVLLQLLRVQWCFAKPCRVRITQLETGSLLASGHKDTIDDPGFDPGWLSLVTDLSAIQERTGKVIRVPTDREFAPEEQISIIKLRLLLRDSSLTDTWRYVDASWPSTDALAMLEHMEQRSSNRLVLERTENITLFDAELSLGRVRFIFQDARLVNEAEIRAQLDAGVNEDSGVLFRFVPGDDKKVICDYPSWSQDP